MSAETETCRTCGGSGRVPKPCALCNGMGFVTKSVAGQHSFSTWNEPCPNGCPTLTLINAEDVYALAAARIRGTRHEATT